MPVPVRNSLASWDAGAAPFRGSTRRLLPTISQFHDLDQVLAEDRLGRTEPKTLRQALDCAENRELRSVVILFHSFSPPFLMN
jgi:hypothetical protein